MKTYWQTANQLSTRIKVLKVSFVLAFLQRESVVLALGGGLDGLPKSDSV